MGASGSISSKSIYYCYSCLDEEIPFLRKLNDYINSIQTTFVDKVEEAEIIILPVTINMISDFDQCKAINTAIDNKIPILFICLEKKFNPKENKALSKIMNNYTCLYEESDFNTTIKKINDLFNYF